jgi:VWFA-related protein
MNGQLLIALLLCFSSLPAHGQQGSAPTAAAGSLGGTTGPVLVKRPPDPPNSRDADGRKVGRITLDVTVTDASGKPIGGLTEKDFTLLDNNQPARILALRAGAGIGNSPDPVQVILLIDAVNNTFQSVASERDQVTGLLSRGDGQLAVPTSIALFTDSGVQLDQPTRDGKLLAAELKKMPGGVRTIDQSMGGEGAIERFNISLKTLGQLLAYEQGRPGRKLLIWIGPGWPLLAGVHFGSTTRSKDSAWALIVSFAAHLRNARTTLYSVDPLSSGTSLLHNSFYKTFLKAVTRAEDADAGNLGLQVLAIQSGGRVLNASNDLAGEIASCMEDVQAFYTVTLQIPAAETVDQYHPLEVRMSQPGLIARTTAGYYDEPNPESSPAH